MLLFLVSGVIVESSDNFSGGCTSSSSPSKIALTASNRALQRVADSRFTVIGRTRSNSSQRIVE